MKHRNLIISLVFVLFAGAGTLAQEQSTPAPLPKIINGGVLNGKAVSLAKPFYPEEARIAKVGGSINVVVTIDEAGNVIEAKAEEFKTESTDPEIIEKTRLMNLLVDSAEQAAQQAQFSPVYLSGVPVKVTGRIVYNFNAETNKPSAISGGVLNGKAIELPKPAYPPAALAVRAGGAVNVQVTIDEEGKVISASAVSGHPLLRGVSETAARGAVFSPTTLSGVPIKVTGVLVFNFTPPKDKDTN